MTQGHALWQRVFREVRAAYPEIEPRHLYIDALALLMVQDPSQFDVIVTNNLFGDIITDLGAALQGGLDSPRRAICTLGGRRCSSRCTGRRRRWPGRTWRTRWARSCRLG